ncbi:hypothetical protein UA08_06321 [Talaromyces atroroseus]|uniref:Transcription factor domain-containing protein n=1 Tax=Talaromyces atroroseus TaxID=1441469 RepID=A0A225ACC0_TALAT|nr:hypothetical protein UA08_06321 [Talaromyces atroroseus]OKL58732.1 hypothetical protein UA08_06321 [Talaromyces atroroseus]
MPGPPPSVANISKAQKWQSLNALYDVSGPEQILSEDLVRLGNAKDSTFLLHLREIIARHRQVLDRITESFLSSCQKWMPIFYPEIVDQPDAMARESMALLLSMCMVMRPLVSGNNQPDALREYLYLIAKRLFWDPATAEKPTTALMKAGLLISVYEYGHGLLNASFITLSVCSSMAQVTKLGGIVHECPILPPFGTHPIKENDLKLWWSIKIHEIMISLKSGLSIRPLIIDESEIMDNHRLKADIEYVKPQLILDQHYISFHLQARAAIWLDLVLGLVRSPVITTSTSTGRLRFQAVDQGLLQFLSVLFGLGMGVCCEAISISLNAFVHLHQSRIQPSSPFIFTEQERLESFKAIETMLRVISDFFEDFALQNPDLDINENSKSNHETNSGMIADTFPYMIHLVYVLLLKMREHRYIPESLSRIDKAEKESHFPSAPTFEREIKALHTMLHHSSKRWQISRDYICLLDRSTT